MREPNVSLCRLGYQPFVKKRRSRGRVPSAALGPILPYRRGCVGSHPLHWVPSCRIAGAVLGPIVQYHTVTCVRCAETAPLGFLKKQTSDDL